MNCVTGKKSYSTKEIAEEALINNHITFNHRAGSGPINVYQCSDCGCWHFTSKGEVNPILNNSRTKSFIRKESDKKSWEDKFR